MIRKALSLKKKGIKLTVKFKAPLEVNYDAPADQIMEQVMDAIEQSKKFMMQGPHHWKSITTPESKVEIREEV